MSNSQLGYCVNCGRSPNKNSNGGQEQGQEEIVYEVQFDTQDDDDDDSVQVPTVTVTEILSSIYNLQYLDCLKYLDTEDPLSSLSTNNNNENTNNEEEKFGICEKCHAVLAQLFRLFGQFNSLRVFDSYLSNKLMKLDNLIRRLHATTNGNDEDGETIIKSEQEDDDDDGSDIVQPLKINSEEKQSHLDVNKNQKKYDMKYDSANNDSFPMVKIRRLRDDEIKAATTTERKQVSGNVKSLVDDINIDDESGNNFSPHMNDDLSEDDEDSHCGTAAETCANNDGKDTGGSSASSSTKRKKKLKQKIQKEQQRRNRGIRNYEKLVDGACPACPVTLKNFQNTYKHLLIHIGPENSGPFPNCQKFYATRSVLISHIRRSHMRQGQLDCPVPNCDIVSHTNSAYRLHLRTHWQKEIYICEKCEQIFSTKQILLAHQESDHTKKHHTCPSLSCTGKTFGTELQLNNQLKTVHSGVNLYPCDICPKSFAMKLLLQNHSATHKHDRGGFYTCSRKAEGCRGRFKTEAQAKDHEETCSFQPFVCEICAKSFKSKFNFNAHLKSHQANQVRTTFLCDHEGCDKVFVSQVTLLKHLKRRHSGPRHRNYTCDQCGLSFYDSSQLKAHQRVHFTEKSFLCTVCGKKFLRKIGLDNHILSHGDLKLFRCSVQNCDKVFKFRTNRDVHIRAAHKGGYCCHLCSAKYTSNRTLKNHLKTVHPQDDDEAI